MEEIHRSKMHMEDKIASSITNLKHEMTTAQERTSRNFSWKMATSTYHFKKRAMNSNIVLMLSSRIPFQASRWNWTSCPPHQTSPLHYREYRASWMKA